MASPKKSSPPTDTDPYIYASTLNGYVTDNNPLKKLLSDLLQMIQAIVHLRKNRQMAQGRIDQIQNQIEKIKEDMASVNQTQVGTRFNKLR